MKQRLLYLLKLLALFSLTAYISGSSASNAQNKSKAIEITGKDGKSVVLYEQSHALIIWVRDYQHWGTLEAVPKGGRLLEKALKQRGFNVIVQENPNSQQLRDVVTKFIGEYGYKKDNRLVIFFAGHGWTIDDTDGYIVPSNAPDPLIDEPGFFNFAISMEEVMAWARRIKANHAFFVFDSCFSGTLFETKNRPNPKDAYIRTLTAKPVRQFLTAGDAGEEVPAGNDFVELFIQGLDGEADFNQDGYVTGLELGTFVQTTLPGLTRNAQSPQYGKIQNTRLRQGDIVFRSLPLTPDISSNPNLISKITGVDYTKLHNHLVAGEWEEADRETTTAMLRAAKREQERGLRLEDLNSFACEDLRIIDQLWLESSQGKFGFSVQKEIWQNNGSPTNVSKYWHKNWRQFYIDVGWKTEQSGIESGEGYVSYHSLGAFTDIDSSSRGNLPRLEFPVKTRYHSLGVLSRAANCNL